MLIRNVFSDYVHIEVNTITASRPCTCVLIHLRYICDFTSCFQCLKIKENGDINNHLTSSTKNDQKYFLVIKTQNILRFSKSIYIHYINTIVYHYYIGRLYRKAEQRVSSHLNTFIVF